MQNAGPGHVGAGETVRDLLANGAIAQKEVLVAETELAVATAVEIAVAPGEYRSDTTSTAITVADLVRVWIVASVPESALARIQVGQRVTIDVAAYPDEPFEGQVARVAGRSIPRRAACASSQNWTIGGGC
jgi:cobalt-zinc-cadmium efflux system membrane fusion protein